MKQDIDSLRFSTAGSVDDGKSTLIGRLLFDSKSILEDQLAAVGRATQKRGQEGLDLSLLTDGLTAEREQGITIDVAYRYFATPTRRFIIADTPGHEQFTRNMVTGASTSDVAVVLVDASKGVLAQTRRHAAVAALLDIPHVVLAINKMDLVNYDEAIFNKIKKAFRAIATELSIRSLTVIPISALKGDNVVSKSVEAIDNLPWYQGPTLLSFLENVAVDRVRKTHLRFPVQLVSRVKFGAEQESRGYLGQLESGTVKVGERVVVLPSRETARVAEIITVDGTRKSAAVGEAITLTLDRQVDISRGDVIVEPTGLPRVTDRFRANVCWLGNEPLSLSTGPRRYLVKHLTRTVRAVIERVNTIYDIETLLATKGAETLTTNQLGELQIRTSQPLILDPYWANHATGSFILIDEISNATVAAGTVLSEPDLDGQYV
jgi:sulfate adenylyltransferase subunit 1